jgi:hypothetical protein
MFPDGGYSPLVNHPYAEAAHWEPFQDRVLEWIRAEHLGDAQHEAFLYGLAAHGLGDQLFDAMYLYRADEGQPDQATDIAYAALLGGHTANDHFVPYDGLVPLFADAGVSVDADTLRAGMDSLDIAVVYVRLAAEVPTTVEAAHAEAPWATAHLDDSAIPGAPVCIGKTLADYWLVLEHRLAGEPIDDLILQTFPADGSYAHPTDGRDALISIIFARGMVESTVEADGGVALSGPDGDVPVDAWLFYRHGSHVLNLQPTVPLADNATYTVTVQPGPTSIGGDALTSAVSFGFSTGLAPVEPVESVGPESCGCVSGAPSIGWVLLVVLPLLPCRRRRANASR